MTPPAGAFAATDRAVAVGVAVAVAVVVEVGVGVVVVVVVGVGVAVEVEVEVGVGVGVGVGVEVEVVVEVVVAATFSAAAPPTMRDTPNPANASTSAAAAINHAREIRAIGGPSFMVPPMVAAFIEPGDDTVAASSIERTDAGVCTRVPAGTAISGGDAASEERSSGSDAGCDDGPRTTATNDAASSRA